MGTGTMVVVITARVITAKSKTLFVTLVPVAKKVIQYMEPRCWSRVKFFIFF